MGGWSVLEMQLIEAFYRNSDSEKFCNYSYSSETGLLSKKAPNFRKFLMASAFKSRDLLRALPFVA